MKRARHKRWRRISTWITVLALAATTDVFVTTLGVGDRLIEWGIDAKKVRQLDGYVGFANLPNQVYRKAVKKGFEFTLMVAGESGLGKSTLINSMFLNDIYSADYPGPSARIKKTVKVRLGLENAEQRHFL